MQHIFRLHGLPRNILSNRGPQFTARFWVEFCRLLGITVSLSSGFYPQANGQTKCLMPNGFWELETSLWLLCSQDPTSWAKNVVWVEYAHNSLPSLAKGLTPFQTVYGYQPTLFSNQETEVMVPSAFPLIRRCHLAWSQTLLYSVQRYKKWADKRWTSGPVTWLVRGCGCPLLTFPYGWRVGNWLPGSKGPLSSPK